MVHTPKKKKTSYTHTHTPQKKRGLPPERKKTTFRLFQTAKFSGSISNFTTDAKKRGNDTYSPGGITYQSKPKRKTPSSFFREIFVVVGHLGVLINLDVQLDGMSEDDQPHGTYWRKQRSPTQQTIPDFCTCRESFESLTLEIFLKRIPTTKTPPQKSQQNPTKTKDVFGLETGDFVSP